jgi:N-acetylmuramoyl-L-alanine amidase
MATIVIDAGHGGTRNIGGSNANNAKGPAGTLEKTLTLDIAKRCVAPLRASGHRVELVRSADVNLTLADRASVAQKLAAAVFVSIHFNGFNDASVQGTETWTDFRATERSRRLADAVQRALLKATKYKDRGLRSKELGVLNPGRHHPNTAACLVEISFLTDPADERRLSAESYRDAVAKSISNGVQAFLVPARLTKVDGRDRRDNDCPMLDDVQPSQGARRPRATAKSARRAVRRSRRRPSRRREG